MQRQDMQKMQDRLQTAIIQDESATPLIMGDLDRIFADFGLDKKRTEETKSKILMQLLKSTDLRQTERKIHSDLESLKVDGKSLISIFQEKMNMRGKTIYTQVGEFFHFGQSIIDWSCGDARVTDYLHKHISHNIEGSDVYKRLGSDTEPPIHLFDGKRIHVSSGSFEAGLMTNVAPHIEDEAKVLTEIARIIRIDGRLVVIKTVPVSSDPAEIERTFVNEYVYHRLFQDADVPVAGVYDTEAGWISRFAEAGFKLESITGRANPFPLVLNIPTICNHHIVFVFRRV